jgi:predicted transglutaminase-like cysteine proteinase
MGKGQIISNLENGLYSVKIIYGYRDKVDARIANMENQIILLNQKIGDADEGIEKEIMEMQVTSLEKQIEYLTNYFPDDPTVNIWCSDLSTGLSGYVGLIEIPDEIAEKITLLNLQSQQTTEKYTKVHIRPGFEDDAVYSLASHGEVVPVVAMSAAQMFWNKSALPGVQKWQPRYRYGVIVADSIDFEANTCSVCLDPEYSSQQNLGINQGDTFSECDGLIPDGFTQFCTDNPTHETCTNTEDGGGYFTSNSMWQTIKSVNQSVNQDHEYETDKSGYGIGEVWREMSAGEKGDCEDYALTKQKALSAAGIPIQHLQIAIGETETGGWHAFLMIRSANRGTIILDNRYDNVMSLDQVPYRFHSYQRAGDEWNGYGVRLTDVPVEYMSCNVGAFADGDPVIIEFTDRDFSQPKVIGFRSNPSGCISHGICFWSSWTAYTDMYGWIYYQDTDAWVKTGIGTAQVAFFSRCASPDWGGAVHYLGGNHDIMAPVADRHKTVKYNYQYTVNLDSWAIKTEMNQERQYHIAFSFNGFLNVYGGKEDNVTSVALDSNEKYDPDTESWISRMDGDQKIHMSEFVIEGKGYSLGGFPAVYFENAVNDNNQYDPVENQWSTKSVLPASMYRTCAFADYSSNKGHIVGGVTYGQWDSGKSMGGGYYLTKRHYEYDPVTNVWTRKQDASGYGCRGIYVDYAPPDDDKDGWYVDPDTCQSGEAYGPYNVSAYGLQGGGVVIQVAEWDSPYYHVMATQQYDSESNAWTSKESYLQPTNFQIWSFVDGDANSL